MGLLDGQIQRAVSGATRWLMLDATFEQTTKTYVPGTGSTLVTTTKTIRKAGYPDEATDRYRSNAQLDAGERLIVLLQRPIRAAGWTLAKGNKITMRSKKSEILEITEDPAQATYVCKVKDL